MDTFTECVTFYSGLSFRHVQMGWEKVNVRKLLKTGFRFYIVWYLLAAKIKEAKAIQLRLHHPEKSLQVIWMIIISSLLTRPLLSRAPIFLWIAAEISEYFYRLKLILIKFSLKKQRKEIDLKTITKFLSVSSALIWSSLCEDKQSSQLSFYQTFGGEIARIYHHLASDAGEGSYWCDTGAGREWKFTNFAATRIAPRTPSEANKCIFKRSIFHIVYLIMIMLDPGLVKATQCSSIIWSILCQYFCNL